MRWLLVLIAAAAALALPVGAQADILINAVPKRVCFNRAWHFEVGVWYRPGRGGANRYQIEIYNPGGRLFFIRSGAAPSADWRFWKIKVAAPGTYTTVYTGPGFSQKYRTLVAACSG